MHIHILFRSTCQVTKSFHMCGIEVHVSYKSGQMQKYLALIAFPVLRMMGQDVLIQIAKASGCFCGARILATGASLLAARHASDGDVIYATLRVGHRCMDAQPENAGKSVKLC